MKSQPRSDVAWNKIFVITKQTEISIWIEADSTTTVYTSKWRLLSMARTKNNQFHLHLYFPYEYSSFLHSFSMDGN